MLQLPFQTICHLVFCVPGGSLYLGLHFKQNYINRTYRMLELFHKMCSSIDNILKIEMQTYFMF